MMCVRRVHIAICVSPMVLISSALFPWYQLRAILILISYIDTCALPVVECNKRIVSGRLYCADRECSIAQAQDDDSFLTVIFSDACQVFTEKNICDKYIWGTEMPSCLGRKFPCVTSSLRQTANYYVLGADKCTVTLNTGGTCSNRIFTFGYTSCEWRES